MLHHECLTDFVQLSGAYASLWETTGFETLYLFGQKGAENVVKLWSPETGEFIRNLTGHTEGLSDIAWTADSTLLASASDDTTIRIWNVETVR